MKLVISAPNRTLQLPTGVQRTYCVLHDLSNLEQVPKSYRNKVIIDNEQPEKTVLNAGPSHPDFNEAMLAFDCDLNRASSIRPSAKYAFYDGIHTNETTSASDLSLIRWNNLALAPLIDRQDFLCTTAYFSGDYDASPWVVPCIDTMIQLSRIRGVESGVMISWRYFGPPNNLAPMPWDVYERNLRMMLRKGLDFVWLWCGGIQDDADEYFCRASCGDPLTAADPGTKQTIIDAKAVYGDSFKQADGTPDMDAINRHCAGKQSQAISIAQKVFATR